MDFPTSKDTDEIMYQVYFRLGAKTRGSPKQFLNLEKMVYEDLIEALKIASQKGIQDQIQVPTNY